MRRRFLGRKLFAAQLDQLAPLVVGLSINDDVPGVHGPCLRF
jgi:hypothetical protein